MPCDEINFRLNTGCWTFNIGQAATVKLSSLHLPQHLHLLLGRQPLTPLTAVIQEDAVQLDS